MIILDRSDFVIMPTFDKALDEWIANSEYILTLAEWLKMQHNTEYDAETGNLIFHNSEDATAFLLRFPTKK